MMWQRQSFTSGRLLLWLLIGALMLFVVLPTQATIMQRLEIEELTRLSTDVFHGQVTALETRWNPERTRIYTAVHLRINETFKGSAQRHESVTVIQLGGEKDGRRLDYAGRPEFTVGESIVLFTTRTRRNELTVVALKQGKLHVAGNQAVRDFNGLTIVNRAPAGKRLHPVWVKPERLTLDELRTRIKRVR